jgi:RNA polymerase sigma-70 factor (ECF subfamily)
LLSDAELVKACLNGEKEAFAELVKRYEHPVRAVALDVLRDYHSAADVSQDAFVRSYKNLSELRKADIWSMADENNAKVRTGCCSEKP